MMVSNSEFECCCIDQSACLYLEELPAEEHWVGDALRLAVDELLEQLLVEVVSMSVNQCVNQVSMCQSSVNVSINVPMCQCVNQYIVPPVGRSRRRQRSRHPPRPLQHPPPHLPSLRSP